MDPRTVIARREYAHPMYNPVSVAAQRRLPEANTARVAFAGAYHGWGFHEDGARSGAAAAEHLGLSWDGPDPPRARALRRDDPAHPPAPVAPAVRAPFPRLAGRPRRAARPRPARPLRGPRPPRLTRRHDPRQRRRLPGRARHRRHRWPGADGRERPRLRQRVQPDQRLLVLRPRRSPGRQPSSRSTTPTAGGTPTWSTPTSRAGRASTSSSTSRRSTAPTGGTTSWCRSRATSCWSRSPSTPTTARRSPRPCSGRRTDGLGGARGTRSNPGGGPDPNARYLAVATTPAGARPTRRPFAG